MDNQTTLVVPFDKSKDIVAEKTTYDGEHFEIALFLRDRRTGEIVQDITLVRKSEIGDAMECVVWGNELDEDYTDKFVINPFTPEFDRDEAESELYDRMLHELQAFRTGASKHTPTAIIYGSEAYELIYKEDLLLCFEEDASYLSDADVKCLLDMGTPLEWLYQKWCDSGISHMDMLREFIRNTVQTQEVHND